MTDLKTKKWIVAKGVMFFSIAALTAALVLLETPSLTVAACLVLLVRTSCRFYIAWSDPRNGQGHKTGNSTSQKEIVHAGTSSVLRALQHGSATYFAGGSHLLVRMHVLRKVRERGAC